MEFGCDDTAANVRLLTAPCCKCLASDHLITRDEESTHFLPLKASLDQLTLFTSDAKWAIGWGPEATRKLPSPSAGP